MLVACAGVVSDLVRNADQVLRGLQEERAQGGPCGRVLGFRFGHSGRERCPGEFLGDPSTIVPTGLLLVPLAARKLISATVILHLIIKTFAVALGGFA